jgi:hypothetical protein
MGCLWDDPKVWSYGGRPIAVGGAPHVVLCWSSETAEPTLWGELKIIVRNEARRTWRAESHSLNGTHTGMKIVSTIVVG